MTKNDLIIINYKREFDIKHFDYQGLIFLL